ncbi:hypothetical protein G6F24_009917 [Rhizopus arrhizus]|nr:hypothetical protein G6F24_009917 [Rhizopus arrhizus]
MYALNNMLSRDHHHVTTNTGYYQRLPYVTASVKRSPLMNHYNRLAYVDALVDANAMAIESIWNMKVASNSMNVVPLRTFIQEVLKRSRTTYSTLQTALFYLFRIRSSIVSHLSKMHNRQPYWEDAYVSCGRRMFLASLVVASKFVQDKTYRNSAWAKIAGLPVSEINAAERIFLNMIDYQLYISQPTFEQWYQLLHTHIEAKTQNQPTLFNDLSLTAPDLIHTPTSPATPPSFSPEPVGWTLSPTHFLQSKKRFKKEPIPLLSMSLPSSIHSSPMQTPSPIRIISQKRKYVEDEDHFSIGYHVSHVRQSSKRSR